MNTRQHELWLLAAVAAPIAHFAGCGWVSALLAAGALLPLALLPKNWVCSKTAALVQILWLGVVAGYLLPGSAAYWPSGNHTAVPLTLLTLAALTKADRIPRAGAVLAFCMGLLALPAALSGAARLEPDWLKPDRLSWEPGLILALLLTHLPAGHQRKGSGLLTIGILTAALAALVQGTLSAPVAEAVPDSFFQTARALGHMEPIIAAGMTLGWYAAASLLFASSAEFAKSCGLGERLPYVLVWGTGATLILLNVQLSAPFLMGFSAFLWILAPIFQKIKK